MNEKRAKEGGQALTQLEGSALEDLRPKLEKTVKQFLFAGEAALPEGGLKGDPAFVSAFQAGKQADPAGRSLRDFDLRTRLMRYRCSHMILSPQFQGMPREFQSLVYARILEVLRSETPIDGYDPLPVEERSAIIAILSATLPDFRKLGLASR